MISDVDESAAPCKLVAGRTQRLLLELSTIFYFFARNAAIPLVQQYVYHLVARKYNLTEQEAAAAADADEGLRPVTNSSTDDDGQLQTSTDGHLVCIRTVQQSIPWGHSGPLCHALSLSSSWTSMRRRRATRQ